MKQSRTLSLSLLGALLAVCVAAAQPRAATMPSHKVAAAWLTTPDRSSLFARQPELVRFAKAGPALPASTIKVDDSHVYQPVDGFGFALTGGSAQLIMRMHPAARARLLHELFSTDGDGIGVSYLRVSIGASDMNDHVYTYDDMPAGTEDPDLKSFSLGPDLADVVPVLQAILAVNPRLSILATPWTAPAWMKTNDNVKGGSLKPENYDVYARYLIKYMQAMEARGIPIHALTMQNEPLNPKNTPSMKMEAAEEALFLKRSLGPLLHKAAPPLRATRIILYDHNCDVPEYPMSILADKDAGQYADGSGFHLYEGDVSAMSKVHDAYPAKNVYFTEQMVIDRRGNKELAIAEPEQRIIIGAMKNWSRNVLLWNLAADPQNGPHTSDGGCPICEGAITLDGDSVTRNLAYYTIAHASKFVRPGSVRIGSNSADLPATLSQVAFKTPGGKLVLIVVNASTEPASFTIGYHGAAAAASLPAGAAATYVW